MRISQYWLYLFLVVSAAAFFIFQQTQPPLTYEMAPLFDGNYYKNIYYFFIGDLKSYEVPFPFHSRVLVPWLASLVNSGNIILDFTIVHFVFLLLSVWMLFKLWKDLQIPVKWMLVGFFWLLLHWTGIVRLNIFDPINVDVPLYFLQALFLWLVLRRKFFWLLILAPIATIQKESFIGIMVILFLYGWSHNRKKKDGFFNLKLIFIALLLAVITKEALNYLFPPGEASYGSLFHIGLHAIGILMEPLKVVRWLLALFVAFGPFLIPAAIETWQHRFYENRKNLLLLFSLLYIAFGLLAGGDMTRIIFLGFPFIMTWIMHALREIKTTGLIILVLFSIPLMFLLKSIPDPAFEWELWCTWYPENAPVKILVFYAGYAALCMTIMHFLKNQLKSE